MSTKSDLDRAIEVVNRYRQAEFVMQVNGKNGGDRESHKRSKEMLDRLLSDLRALKEESKG